MHFCIDFAYVASSFLQFVLFVTCIFALILHMSLLYFYNLYFLLHAFLHMSLMFTFLFSNKQNSHMTFLSSTLNCPNLSFFLSFFKLDIFIKPNKIKRFQQIRITIGQRACKEVPLKMLLHISKTLNFGMPIN